MADDVSRIDNNRSKTLIALDNLGDIRAVRLDSKGSLSDRIARSIYVNQVTVGTAVVALSTTSTTISYVKVKNISATGDVFVGMTGLTTANGWRIGVKEETPVIRASNLTEVYCLAEAADKKFCYIAELL